MIAVRSFDAEFKISNESMPLLSRSLDPLLGVFTGVLAFYMAETNPRTAPPREETLGELLRWKREKWLKQRAESNADSETYFSATPPKEKT